MKIYRKLEEVPAAKAPAVATIGNFDGVHLGHQSVIAEVIARARFLGGQSLAITFDPHPAQVLRPAEPCPLITPLPGKLELLAATGLDATLVLPFDEALRHTSARDFAQRILRDTLHVTEVHEGENFRFGHNAEAGVDGLAQLGHALGFRVTAYAPLTLRGAPVSSSRIRSLIAEAAATRAAALAEARALLGRPFSIDSHPAPGRGYGAKYTVPTINLAAYPDLLPAHGVYIATLRLGGDESFESVTNIGNRPTFGPDSFAIETHLLNPDAARLESLSERTPLRLTFLRRLRAELRFDSTVTLRAQIAQDIARAQHYFALCRALGRA
ncbi:MAG: riboflavin kinase [Acidobacteriaceae bacterium]|jgi:riboflavin kinase/FMN adenylyltransferase